MATTNKVGPDKISVARDFESVRAAGNIIDSLAVTYAGQTLLPGTAALQTDRQYVNLALTIAASGNLTVNLSSFTDAFGNAGLAMARIKRIYVENNIAGLASALTVGGAAILKLFNNVASGVGLVNNGTAFYMGTDPGATGWVVAAGSMVITNLDVTNAAVVNVVVDGCSV